MKKAFFWIIFATALNIYTICPGTNGIDLNSSITTPGSIRFSVPDSLHGEYLFFELKNTGSSTVKNIWVKHKNDVDLRSVDALVHDLLENKKTDKEKVMSIYEFLVAHRYHFYPPTERYEEHDPILWLNVYGYGFCDDAALAAQYLCNAAGYKSRVWFLKGHMVPEVMYNNKWHHLDPDQEAIYRKPDGSIYSVEELIERPEVIDNFWIKKTGSTRDEIRKPYITEENNRAVEKILGHEGYSPCWKLRPGEGFKRWKSHRVGPPVVLSYENKVAPRYASAELSFTLPMKKLKYINDIETNNLEVVHASDRTLLTIKNKKKDGTIIIPFTSPYVFIDGTIKIQPTMRNNDEKIHVFLSRDKKSWEPIVYLEGPDSAPLKSHLLGKIFHCYRFYIKIGLQGDSNISGKSCYIEDFEGHFITQCSPFTFPALKPGKPNEWEIDFTQPEKSEQESSVELNFSLSDYIHHNRR